jgi:excinuclease UvrABC nuclease subunit
MKKSANERRYEEAAESKHFLSQIDATGNRQIVRDAIAGDATIIVTLEKYNHVFISFVEIKNSMVIGVREYKLANPLEDDYEILIGHAVSQYILREDVKIIYTDIDISSLSDLSEYIHSEKITVRQPSRGEKVRILEFAHTNLLNFAFQEEMS